MKFIGYLDHPIVNLQYVTDIVPERDHKAGPYIHFRQIGERETYVNWIFSDVKDFDDAWEAVKHEVSQTLMAPS